MSDEPRRAALIAEIADLEARRALLGDRIVDLAVVSLREQLDALAPLDHHAEGERKLVTVMFADASGFTAMSEGADPEHIRELLNRCFERLVPVVERFGGTIDKFIGDAIMALFGAPVVRENDAERALRAALAIMDELAAFNREQGVSLGIHFGINTGEVIAGEIGAKGRRDYSVIGDAVNVAARLQDLSARGEIYVGPETWRQTRDVFDFEVLEPTTVRGRSAAVAVYKLLGLKRGQSAQPANAGAAVPEMIGREAEVARIMTHVEALRAGRGALLLVTAPAGIGKSRLVAEAHARMPSDVFWLEGRADTFSTSASYGVTLDLLFKILELPADADAGTIREALRALCHRLLPASADASYAHLATLFGFVPEDDVLHHVDGVAASTLQARIAQSFDRLVHAAARGRRLVLCLEDAHWMDAASLELLDNLARPGAPNPALILLTSRPEGEGGERLSILADRIAEHLRLEPLDRAGSAQLARNFVGAAGLPDRIWDVVLDRAEGNPFYLEEMLRSLIEAGAISTDPAIAPRMTDLDVAQLPPTLRGIVMARLDRLPADCKRTLQTASVLGRVFQLRLLARLAEGDSAGATSKLEQQLGVLEAREFLNGLEAQSDRAEFEYIFKHAVTQEVAYNSLLKTRRSELHKRSAEAIEILFDDRLDELASTLAMHFARAEQPARACAYYLRAARRASAIYAHDEVHALYQRILELLPALEASDPAAGLEVFTQVQLGLGELLKVEGRYDEAQAAFLKAHEAAREPWLRAAAHRRFGLTLMGQRRSREALECYDKAAAELGEPGPDFSPAVWEEWIEIELERLWAHYWLGDSAAMRAIVERAARPIDAHGTNDQKSRLFKREILISFRENNLSIPDATMAMARQSFAFARDHTNADDLARGHFMVATCLMWRRELIEAEDEFVQSLRLSEHTGNIEYKVMSMSYITLIRRMLKDREAVAVWATRSLSEARALGMPLYAGMARANQAWLSACEDDWASVRDAAAPTLAAWRQTPFQIAWIAGWPLLAAAIAEETWADAREPLEAMLRGDQHQPSRAIAALLRSAQRALAEDDLHAAAASLRFALPEAQALGLA
jgi:class 3 adenylate cyclase/tetratricopeptide (TPR) repeat protein